MVALYRETARPLAPTETITHEGGIAFTADKWARLRRWLILGSEGTFYATGPDLTAENVGIVRECLAENWEQTLQEVLYVSDKGLATKHEPALLALALTTLHESQMARAQAFSHLAAVCRTGTHLLHFASYREALGGGWGRGMRNAVGRWFNHRPPDKLAYQAVKYKSRDGWSLADLLRLAHPVPVDKYHSYLYQWIVDGVTIHDEWYEMLPDLIQAVSLFFPQDPAEAAQTIRAQRIPREAVPTELLNDPMIWDALLDDMPMTAMIRNLGKMSNVGLLAQGSDAARTVVSRLGDMDRLRKARVHPIAILAALKVYEQGHGEKGSLKWSPVKGVINALDEAFYLAFGTVEPTRKRIRLALDVSASMDGSKVNGMSFLTAREVSAAFALVTAAVEPDAHFVAYSHTLVGVNIRPSMRLDEVVRTLATIPMGGTFCSLPIIQAIAADAEIDAFVSYTDSETWDGGRRGYGFGDGEQPPAHTASESLREYRLRSGINARHAVVACASNGFTIADPSDPGQLDVVGFSADTPQVLSGFIDGVL